MSEQLDTLLSEQRRFPPTAEFAARSAVKRAAQSVLPLTQTPHTVPRRPRQAGGQTKTPESPGRSFSSCEG